MVDDVDCSNCGLPFVCSEENMIATTKHKCGNCGTTTKGNKLAVCNPLALFVLNGNDTNPFDDLEIVAFEDVVECVTKNGGTLTETDIKTYINEHTPTVVQPADVSARVAPCAKPPT